MGGPGATEKTDASVPAHEDERAARGRVAFAYATFNGNMQKSVAILFLSGSIAKVCGLQHVFVLLRALQS